MNTKNKMFDLYIWLNLLFFNEFRLSLISTVPHGFFFIVMCWLFKKFHFHLTSLTRRPTFLAIIESNMKWICCIFYRVNKSKINVWKNLLLKSRQSVDGRKISFLCCRIVTTWIAIFYDDIFGRCYESRLCVPSPRQRRLPNHRIACESSKLASSDSRKHFFFFEKYNDNLQWQQL